MNGLTLYTSNSMEILAEQLAQIVREPLPSMFSPEIIVVQSRGMERWISMELARHNGICANCAFPFPNSFLREIFKKVIPNLTDDSSFDPSVMAFKLMNLLPASIHLPGFKNVKRYLEDDGNKMKLYQISQIIADLFDQYLVFRPDMIFKWEKGVEDHWQAELWRKLASEKENRHRAALRNLFFETMRKTPPQEGDFPRRISIFGISYLPPFHFEAFIEMSRYARVNFFLMNPCREYWADIVSSRESKKIREKYVPFGDQTKDLHLEVGNRLLASMGTLGRNFISMISGVECRMVERFDERNSHTILAQIQSDILNLKNRRFSHPQTVVGFQTTAFSSEPPITRDPSQHFDASVQIHSCHSPMREVEVLHDVLFSMFEADSDLLPKDVVIMTPDIESYAPFIRAVFETQTDEKLRIPFTIADQSVLRESRLIGGFLSILDLKNSRLGAGRVMALLEFSEIREKFGFTESDVEVAERWVRETNIRWGIDSEYRRKLRLPDYAENTWKAGIERLLLGYAMPGLGRKMFSGILPYDHIEGSEVRILGKFMKFIDQVFNCVRTLDHAGTLSEWQKILAEILEQFFAPDEDSVHEIQLLLRILDDLAKNEETSGFKKPIDVEIVRSYLMDILEHEQFRSGFISGGVTFCAMLPMRSIPFKVVGLMGMNIDMFPRQSKVFEFDLMVKNPRIGDRSRRNDDKYLFLEALLSARERFYISYLGQSIQDNSRIPPSVVVSELIDYIKDGFGLSEAQMVTFHRLQAFSSEYFKENSDLFSYSRENLSAARRMYARKETPPFFSTRLSEPGREWKNITIKDLSLFFSNPAKYLLQKRLGIYLDEPTVISDERENFNIEPLWQYTMGQEFLAGKMSGSSLKDLFAVKKASGELPHGNVGRLIYNEMYLDAEDFNRKIERHTKPHCFRDVDVDISISDFRIDGRITDVYKNGTIQVRYAKTRQKYILNTWIYHLVLCKLLEDKSPIHSFLLCKDAGWEFRPVSNFSDILKHLLQRFWEGMSFPLRFFPESSHEYVRQRVMKNQSKLLALKAAQKTWLGSDFSRGESNDPYFELCFHKIDPLDAEFEKIAEELYTPLLDHFREIVL